VGDEVVVLAGGVGAGSGADAPLAWAEGVTLPVGRLPSAVVVFVRVPLPIVYPLSSIRGSPGAVGEPEEQAESRQRAAAKAKVSV
jgi:hypothetical protein